MTLREGILAQVDRQPGAPALVWHGEETTYGELHDLARREQDRLGGLGLVDGEALGVLAPKSPDTVALVLACFLAGRPVLLPSPALAERTLRSLFAEAGCRHVLAPDRGTNGAAPARPAPGRGGAGGGPAAGVAIMLTTSGSTGLPKIVPLGWDALDRFVAWAGPRFGIGPGRTVLNYAPLNFDLCLLDVWTTLARGGRVVLVDPDFATQGRSLLDLVDGHGVEVVQAVPMAYRLLLDAARADGRVLPSVEHAIFTGDAVPPGTLAELPRLLPAARLYNVYGCTETNDSFIHEVDRADAGAPAPLGRPLPGVSALIVDDGVVVPGAGTGELYVSTPFQTAGYLDPARGADAFVTRPDGGNGGRRYFRTGDLVRRRADGSILLDGRADFQVKVRGVAVNTAEIERVLVAHPDVREAAVAAVLDGLAGRLLHALVQRAPGSRLNSLALRQHCARRLPAAAIPSSLRIVDDPLPKTPTGKVDRTAARPVRSSDKGDT